MRNFITIFLILLILLGLDKLSIAQDTVYQRLSLPEIFHLAESASQQLKISKAAIDIAGQAKKIAEDQQLPSFTTSLGVSYIGNATVLSKDFSDKQKVPMPHFGNNFSLQASELVFKGGLVKNNIEKASLQEQVAVLNYQKNKAEINLLLAGRYLDLLKLYNQKTVINKNIELAKMRLENINRMHREGMVTKNDQLRVELQISNLNLGLQELENNIEVINMQLVTVLQLPEHTYIQPFIDDSNEKDIVLSDVEDYIMRAMTNYPDIQVAKVNKQIADKNLQLAKAEKMPSLSIYAGNSLQRPITTVSPVVDMYSNAWSAGVTLGFDIASLYKSKQTISLAAMQVNQQDNILQLQKQNSEIEVNAAVINYNQAKERLKTLEQARSLAEENYRIVEKKYYNQLALLTDIIDASNAKLDAEIQLSNGHVSVMYAYYQLQKAIGNLN